MPTCVCLSVMHFLGLLDEATCSEVSMPNLRFASDCHGFASPCSLYRNLRSPEMHAWLVGWVKF